MPVRVLFQQAASPPSAAELAQARAEFQQAVAQFEVRKSEMERRQEQSARDLARMQRGMPFPFNDQLHTSRRQEGMQFAGFLVCVLAAIAIFRPITRSLGRRLEGGPRRDELAAVGSPERLARIEQAVEAMAIEIERISEGQRFTTRLLSERADRGLPLER